MNSAALVAAFILVAVNAFFVASGIRLGPSAA
jgi:hypothetical protein